MYHLRQFLPRKAIRSSKVDEKEVCTGHIVAPEMIARDHGLAVPKTAGQASTPRAPRLGECAAARSNLISTSPSEMWGTVAYSPGQCNGSLGSGGEVFARGSLRNPSQSGDLAFCTGQRWSIEESSDRNPR